MSLTDMQIRKAKPRPKQYKMADGGGLYVLVKPGGGKLWQQKYRFLGKERSLSHGPYPTVTLAQARQKRDEAKALLVEGIDPCLSPLELRHYIVCERGALDGTEEVFRRRRIEAAA